MTDIASFDGENRIITILPNNPVVSTRNDLYGAWKRWASEGNNAAFLPAMRTIGGDPIGGGEFAGDIYFLLNGWQIFVSEFVTFNGVLYHDDPISPFIIGNGGGVTNNVSAIVQTFEVGSAAAVAAAADSVARRVWETSREDIVSGTMKEAVLNTENVTDEINTKTDEISVDVLSVLSNLNDATALIQNILKYHGNRTSIDAVNYTMTIYDDDDITPIKVFDLRNLTGQPSITEVAERVPK